MSHLNNHFLIDLVFQNIGIKFSANFLKLNLYFIRSISSKQKDFKD